MTEDIRNKIIRRYMERVHGKKPDTSKSNKKHDGKEGSWLEDTMGVKRNANNKPDLWGYEMKNHTKSKTSFGRFLFHLKIIQFPSKAEMRSF